MLMIKEGKQQNKGLTLRIFGLFNGTLIMQNFSNVASVLLNSKFSIS